MKTWCSSETQAATKIFICYRRSEDSFAVGHIFDKVEAEFGHGNVFIDVDGIPYGEDFTQKLAEEVGSCDVLLAVITKNWLKLQREDGRRRLDLPDDFVRIEIETALERGIHLIPVLIGDAEMPPVPQSLPEKMRPLLKKHAVRVRGGADLRRDIEALIGAMQNTDTALASVRKEYEEIVAAVVRGEWKQAAAVLGKAAVSEKLQGCAQYRLLESVRKQVEELAAAADAIEKRDFRTAGRALARVDADAPGTVGVVREVVRIGESLCELQLSDIAGIRDIERQLEHFVGVDPEVPGVRVVRELQQKLLREAQYLDAWRAYEAGDFETARRMFEDAGDGKLASRCAIWLAILDNVRAHEWDEARKGLAALSGLPEEPRVREVQKWCVFARRVVPALELLAAGGAVAEERVLWDGGPSPYCVLHVSPATTIEECAAHGYELQAKPGGMTAWERSSWDALRLVEKRLLADFSLYSVRDPGRAAAVLQSHFVFEPGEPSATMLARIRRQPAANRSFFEPLVAELGEDGGVLYALTRDYDAAIDCFLAQARRSPGDPAPLHHLGLAAYGKTLLDPDDVDLTDAWDLIAVAWGAVFADTRFWRSWWVQRRRVYPVPEEEQVRAARTKLITYCADALRAASEDDPGPARLFRVELTAARAVDQLKGIPLAGDGRTRVAVAGPRGIAQLQVEPQFAAWIASFPPAAFNADTPHRRVCVAFSSLASAQSLHEEGRSEEALELLRSGTVAEGQAFAAANPGFAAIPAGRGPRVFSQVARALQQQCHLRVALAAVSESALLIEKAIANWKQALALAPSLRNEEAIRAEIREVVIGRCHVLQNQSGDGHDKLDALNDAVTLAQDALAQEWDSGDGVLRQALIGALLDRATHLSNAFDMEKEARQDAVSALNMAPGSLRATFVLCIATLHYAKELYNQGKREHAQSLVNEVNNRLSEAEQLFPGNADLVTIMKTAAETSAMVADGVNAFERALSALRIAADESKNEAGDSRLAQAMVFQAQSDCPRAVELYWQLAQEKPNDAESLGRLGWCYRQWLIQLRERGDVETYTRIAAEATTRCPNAAALSDVLHTLPIQE
ncbi:MAG TPA: toll/interleukin-1 receptor domain-containing protein [Thermoanaerobaculia bacterium]|nr:toll/interleukin-1 receptor domain-containing protein [Thermoanaerobaculia bacterium]